MYLIEQLVDINLDLSNELVQLTTTRSMLCIALFSMVGNGVLVELGPCSILSP